MFFAKPSPLETNKTKNSAPQTAQLNRKDAGSSLLGTSRVKLVARQPGKTVAPTSDQTQPAPQAQNQSQPMAQLTQSNQDTTITNTAPSSAKNINEPRPEIQSTSSVPASALASAATAAAADMSPTSPSSAALKRRNQQESFLRRLVEIKRQRGDADADAVPMYGVVGAEQPPSGISTEPATETMTETATEAVTDVSVNPGNVADTAGIGDGNNEGDVSGDKTGESRGSGQIREARVDDMDITDGP